jgi:probable addiction module antidote protein
MTKANALGIVTFDAAEYLKDEETIAEFLNASLEMDDPAVLLNALVTIARARSMSQLAAASGLGRESLYKALKPGSHPRYDTVMKLISALGVEMVFRAPARPARKAKAEHKAGSAPVPKRAVPKPPSTESRAFANGEKRASRTKAR